MQGLASRRLAVEVLIKVEQEKAYANLALAAAFRRRSLPERDRAFTTLLVQEIIRHKSQIDQALAHCSKRALAELPVALLSSLRLGAYQLLFMPDVPKSAAINTAVEVAKLTGHSGSSRYASGVLNALSRHLAKGITAEEHQDKDSPAELAARYSVSDWLVAKWLKQFSLAETIQLLKLSQSIPDLTLRVNTEAITLAGYEDILRRNGISFERGLLVPECLRITDRGSKKGPLSKLPGYEEGLFAIQDEASAFAAKVVAPAAGELVVDLCAAPGGKTLYMAELMGNKGRILAVDARPQRLKLLGRERQRLGYTNIEITCADGRTFDIAGGADRVLVDAPCTGTGVMNKKSDIRLSRTKDELEKLVALQRELLLAAAGILKPGGILVYSTCSLEPEENIEQVEWLLEERADLQPVSLLEDLPRPFIASLDSIAALENDRERNVQENTVEEARKGYLQLHPVFHRQSGFFIAKLVKSL